MLYIFTRCKKVSLSQGIIFYMFCWLRAARVCFLLYLVGLLQVGLWNDGHTHTLNDNLWLCQGQFLSLLGVQIQQATFFYFFGFVVWHYYTDSLEWQNSWRCCNLCLKQNGTSAHLSRERRLIWYWVECMAKKELVLLLETKVGGPGNGGISGDPLDFVLSHDGDWIRNLFGRSPPFFPHSLSFWSVSSVLIFLCLSLGSFCLLFHLFTHISSRRLWFCIQKQ